MSAKYDVDSIFAKPVFPKSHFSTELTELVADKTCLIEKAQCVDVSWGLHDAQVNAVGHGVLWSKMFQTLSKACARQAEKNPTLFPADAGGGFD
jgi:hypothetical protein